MTHVATIHYEDVTVEVTKLDSIEQYLADVLLDGMIVRCAMRGTWDEAAYEALQRYRRLGTFTTPAWNIRGNLQSYMQDYF